MVQLLPIIFKKPTSLMNYYVNVGRNIANSFSNVDDYRGYFRGSYPNSFCFKQVATQDIIDVIHSLENKKCDISVLPACVLKVLA